MSRAAEVFNGVHVMVFTVEALSGAHFADVTKRIAKQVKESNIPRDVTVIVLDAAQGARLDCLTEEQMQALGWVRAERLNEVLDFSY